MSVIICVSDTADALRTSFDALRAQSLDAERIEVLVIDGGCTDAVWSGIEAVSSALGFRCTRPKGGGSADGRNLGLAAARAPIVLFCEADEVLDPDCLEEHYLAHERHAEPHCAVLGYTGLRDEAGRSPLMRYLAEADWRNLCCADSPKLDAVDESRFCGRLPSFKRRYLLEHGAFNPLFPAGAESRELGFRLGRAGLRVVYSTEATSVVIRSRGLDEVCRHCCSQGKADWLLTRLYPEQEVREWAFRNGVESEWKAIAPLFHNVMKSARALDQFAYERCRADLPLDDLTTRLLHRAYSAAFRANRVLGAFDAMSVPRIGSFGPNSPAH